MKAFIALGAVLGLFAIAYVAGPGVPALFGVWIPYVAMAVFLVGVVARVLKWGKAPVPFAISTSCGQQKSLPWVKQSRIENPTTTGGVIARMALEILLFRSLFRNTQMKVKSGPRVTYDGDWLLWAAAMAFHYSFLVILLRHMRFFAEPVPIFVPLIQYLDGFFEIGVPTLYMTSAGILGAVTFLFIRRMFYPNVRYISLIADYFPLFLFLGIGVTGVLMRHFMKTDIVGVKELAMGLVTFAPRVPTGIGPIFYAHLFLVSVLLAYIPFSKLVHMAGVFMSPTRNLRANTREFRHINPWNPTVEPHSYEDWEDHFRAKMKACGLPLDKDVEEDGDDKKD